MPFVAHNEDWILGTGETASEARDNMLANHADQAPIVVPATRELVDSIANDPTRLPGRPLMFEEIPASQPMVDGVLCLSEEWLAIQKGQERDGFTATAVRSEIDLLKPQS